MDIVCDDTEIIFFNITISDLIEHITALYLSNNIFRIYARADARYNYLRNMLAKSFDDVSAVRFYRIYHLGDKYDIIINIAKLQVLDGVMLNEIYNREINPIRIFCHPQSHYTKKTRKRTAEQEICLIVDEYYSRSLRDLSGRILKIARDMVFYFQ